jgi:ABC-type dipeptide/oligopeptide/nickel transport system ATPase component
LSLLEVQGLTVTFQTRSGPVEILSSVDFHVRRGSVFGLAGESGCGKSLTALSIMGLLPRGMSPSGAISFDGRDLLGLGPEELRALRGNDISMIFQEPMTSLNPVLRVGHQIEEVLNTHLSVTKKESQRIALGLLRSVRIPDPEVRMREYPHQMSGGMRQRVMMAMAIACSPSLLIADEPTTALDVTIEAQLLELLDTLRKEKRLPRCSRGPTIRIPWDSCAPCPHGGAVPSSPSPARCPSQEPCRRGASSPTGASM